MDYFKESFCTYTIYFDKLWYSEDFSEQKWELAAIKEKKTKENKKSGMNSFSFLKETGFFSVQILRNCKFCLKDLGEQNVLANLPSFGSL